MIKLLFIPCLLMFSSQTLAQCKIDKFDYKRELSQIIKHATDSYAEERSEGVAYLHSKLTCIVKTLDEAKELNNDTNTYNNFVATLFSGVTGGILSNELGLMTGFLLSELLSRSSIQVRMGDTFGYELKSEYLPKVDKTKVYIKSWFKPIDGNIIQSEKNNTHDGVWMPGG